MKSSMKINLFPNVNAKERKKIVVGMSGGVDSSVVAKLLKDQGHEVIGLFMKNWDELDENGQCSSDKDFQDVVSVCEKIDIPYYAIDFVEEYRSQVFEHFLNEYKNGHTPNPDILCNKEIKFKVFFQEAKKMGADYLATGHYARVIHRNHQFEMHKGLDPLKDQSYFLYGIDQNVLNQVLFPLGELNKSEVRQLAKKFDLATKDKKDSTGICFIGERNFKKFLGNYLQINPGPMRTLEGIEVGTHDGVQFYTIGQRKGLGLGGEGAPWFVVGKDIKSNTIFVERGEDHPALYSQELWATDLNWLSSDIPTNQWIQAMGKVRYRSPDKPCKFFLSNDGVLHVVFQNPERAVTLRQSIVLYHQDQCLGGGIISKIGPTQNLIP